MSADRRGVGFALTVVAACAMHFSRAGAQEPPKSPFKVVKKVVVYNGRDPDLENPAAVRCKNGDLLVAFCTQGRLCTTRSRDNGVTWRKPDVIATGGLEGAVGMAVLHDGTVLLPFIHDMVKNPCCADRRIPAFIYRSTDNGVTWQGDAPVDSGFRETVAYGHILELEDGRLLFPFWGARKFGERWQMGTLESADGGKSWGSYRQIAYDPEAGCRPDNGFNETDLTELADHSLLAVLRQQRVGTHAGPCDHYAEPSDHFYRATSHDLGKSWSKAEPIGLIGTSPALHLTPDGILMLAYRDSPQVATLEKGFYERPQISPHYGMALRVSLDEGRTWVDELDLQDPQGIKYDVTEQPGYPDVVDLPGGQIFVVFYSTQKENGKSTFYLAANVLSR